ncbi:protein Lilipod-like [Oppia nitens]|uniref:protein Lilipod-like n=1 Tax=Oppia nitens TaxID=1686743 RepID=UPI0023DC5A44|nr:protein Lilipod-like [Oppia nitens]
MYIVKEDEEVFEVDPREQAFHNVIREHLIVFILFLILYTSSYAIIAKYRRRREELFIDEEDGLVYRISLWMCTISMAVSIGTALLLPFSIVTNEVIILYPDSYYIQWLNDSLIHSLWSYVFVFSNISLFILLPFAYFFTESEGFSGSRKGIMARVYETFILLVLLSVLVLGMTYLMCALMGYEDMGISQLFTLWHYLPFLYSCISFFGVVLLLVCTPLGIVNLFTVLGEVITKPHVLRNTQEEYEETKLEELCLRRKIESHKSSELKPKSPSKSKSMPSLTVFNNTNGEYYPNGVSYRNNAYDHNNGNQINQLKTLNDMQLNLSQLESFRKELEKKLRVGWLRRNLGYPLAMLALMCLTAVAALNVVQNTLELLVGIKTLPLSTTQHPFVLGIASLSKIGAIGAGVEIVLILYLWCASVVGLYRIPVIGGLRPKLNDTLFTQVIGNCAVVLVLSSALPLLARSVGITNFDLLGNFGRVEWLGNFYIVLFQNCVFATTAALCLTTKIVTAVSRELLKRFKEFSAYMREQFNTLSGKTSISTSLIVNSMSSSNMRNIYHNKTE